MGTKEREGDQRTPSGKYYVCAINEESRFKLFFGISYPGNIDAENAFKKGIINKEHRVSIFKSISEKRRPPWDTPMGGEIGIHGGGIDRDGTRGCIGMKNGDILELGKYVEMGTVVEIFWDPDGD